MHIQNYPENVSKLQAYLVRQTLAKKRTHNHFRLYLNATCEEFEMLGESEFVKQSKPTNLKLPVRCGDFYLCVARQFGRQPEMSTDSRFFDCPRERFHSSSVTLPSGWANSTSLKAAMSSDSFQHLSDPD